MEEKKKNKPYYVIVVLISLIYGYLIFIMSSFGLNSLVSSGKPIIYLYPEEKMNITVKLGRPQDILVSYPEYEGEWNVLARPDGSLVDLDTGRNLYALYYEGRYTANNNMEEGFVVKGSDTISFLEEKLEILGLNEREAEEFIVYWLPKMQDNNYNYIYFMDIDEIDEVMPLYISEEPDTLIRVLMQFKPLNEYMEVKEQELEKVDRNGFVVVEWGGTELS